MVNMMALNGAIFMTIRNLVFGPRKNSNIQYVNYGYSKGKPKQRKRPVLIIHSSAAFVKQPEFHSSNEHHGFEHAQSNHQLYENDFYKRRQDENQNAREKYVNRGYGDRRQTVERDRKKANEFRNPNSNRPRTEGNRSKIILRKVVHRIL